MVNFHNVAPLPGVFPYNMMKYITKDPPKTAVTQRKLIQVCTFFYNKHRIVPINYVGGTHNESSYNYYEFEPEFSGGCNPYSCAFNVPLAYRHWLDGELYISSMSFPLTKFLSRVYRFDLKLLCKVDDFCHALKRMLIWIRSKETIIRWNKISKIHRNILIKIYANSFGKTTAS